MAGTGPMNERLTWVIWSTKNNNQADKERSPYLSFLGNSRLITEGGPPRPLLALLTF